MSVKLWDGAQTGKGMSPSTVNENGNGIFVDSNGYIHVLGFNTRGHSHLVYAVSTDGGLTFTDGEGGAAGTAKLLVDYVYYANCMPAIVVDSLGDVYAFYSAHGDNRLTYVKKTSGVWGAPAYVTGAANYVIAICAQIDSDDNIIIFGGGWQFSNYYYCVHTSINRGASWIENIDSTIDGIWREATQVSLFLGYNNNLYASWYNGIDYKIKTIKITKTEGSPDYYTVSAIDNNDATLPTYFSNAIVCERDSETLWLFRSYKDGVNYQLQAKQKVEGTWANYWTTIISNTTAAYVNFQAVRTYDNEIYLVYGRVGNANLYYVKWDGATWGPEAAFLLAASKCCIHRPNLLTGQQKIYFTYKPTANETRFSTMATIVTKTITSDAHIKRVGIPSDIHSDAKIILSRNSKTITSDTYIKQTGLTKTITSNGHIKQTGVTKTITSGANIRGFKEFYGWVRTRIENVTKDFYMQFKIVQPPPTVPTNLVGTDIGTGEAVYLSWDDVSDYSYNVYVKIGGVWIKQNTDVVINPCFTVSGLTELTPYTFMVRGCDGAGTESANSNEVVVTPIFQPSKSASYKVYVNGVHRTDAILKQVEKVFGPSFSSVTFELLKTISSPPVYNDRILITINDKQVFTGLLVAIEDVTEPQTQSVSYTAICDLWAYTWMTALRDYNTTDEQEIGFFWYTSGISNHIGIPTMPVSIYPGSISIKDSTLLDAMVTLLGYCGNYKIYTDPYGNTKYYQMGTGPNRVLEIGKQILSQTLRTDITRKIDKVTVYREWSDVVEKVYSVGTPFPTAPLEITLSGYKITGVQVEALVYGDCDVQFVEGIDVVPGHCKTVAGTAVPALTAWPDEGGTGPKHPIAYVDTPTPAWAGANAQIVNIDRDHVKVIIPSVVWNKKPVTHSYVATFYDSAGSEYSESLEVLTGWREEMAAMRIKYTIESNTYQWASAGSGRVQRTLHDDTLSGNISSRAAVELAKGNIPYVGGEIFILGDETMDLCMRVNGMDVTRVVHDFSQGFTTRITLTNEPFYMGPSNNITMKNNIKSDERTRDNRGFSRHIYWMATRASGTIGASNLKTTPEMDGGSAHYAD